MPQRHYFENYSIATHDGELPSIATYIFSAKWKLNNFYVNWDSGCPFDWKRYLWELKSMYHVKASKLQVENQQGKRILLYLV